VNENLNHPSAERLNAYVENVLDEGDGAVVASHLLGCEGCRTEVAELRSLFDALAGLPELVPSAGFAGRVMARVRVRRPLLERALEWLERLAPSTTRGWVLATGVAALPVLATCAIGWWLLSHPGVTPQTLWLMASSLTEQAMSSGWQWAWARLAGTTLAATAGALLEAGESLGRGGLGLAAVMFATLTLGSLYILYQNLFRTDERRTEHATYVF
jgi:anti-sigma factor RsiW